MVVLIDAEDWPAKGDAYEGWLPGNAQDIKFGAGQYFPPRPNPGVGGLHRVVACPH